MYGVNGQLQTYTAVVFGCQSSAPTVSWKHQTRQPHWPKLEAPLWTTFTKSNIFPSSMRVRTILCVCRFVHAHTCMFVCVRKKERDWAEREGGMSNTNNIPLPLLALPAALSHCLYFFFTALLGAHLQSAQKRRPCVLPLSFNCKDVKYFRRSAALA